MSINKTFILTLLLLLSFFKPVLTPSDLTPSPTSPPAEVPSPTSPPADTPSPTSPPADTPSPADTPFAENVKSEEREESGSGDILVGVMVALCVVVLGHLVGFLHNYHPVIQLNPQVNIADNPPERLNSLTKIKNLNSSSGFSCSYGDEEATNTKWVVVSNPTNAAVVPVEIDVTPDYDQGYRHSVVGFGGQNGHPKLLKTSVMLNDDGSGRPTWWDVQLFHLSTGVWQEVYRGLPFESCKMACSKVCENGRVIYFLSYDLPASGYLRDRSNFFISFDLETMEFGKVPLPSCLVHTTRIIDVAKVNGSLGILEYHEGVYDVWAKRWGASDTFFWRMCNYFGVYETFVKIGTINVEKPLYGGYGAPVAEVVGGYRWWYFLRLLI